MTLVYNSHLAYNTSEYTYNGALIAVMIVAFRTLYIADLKLVAPLRVEDVKLIEQVAVADATQETVPLADFVQREVTPIADVASESIEVRDSGY